MASLRRIFGFTLAVLVTLIVGAAPAYAQTVAGLQFEYSEEVSEALQNQLTESLQQYFDESTRYAWVPTERARENLDPVVRDCFTEDCLRRAGRTLASDVGLRVKFEVESQIYEWTVDFFSLYTGENLATERGTCELCGRSEVLEQFGASIRGPLAVLDLDEQRSPPLDTGLDPEAEGKIEVRITVIPQDTRIFLDDTPVGEGTVEIPLDPGTYELRFSHDTHHGLRETIIVSESSPPLLFLRVHLSRGAGAPAPAAPRSGGMVDRLEPNRKILGWTAIGVGVMVTATSFFVSSLHGQPNCSGGTFAQCPEVYNTAALGTSLTILGSASLATGGLLLAWHWLAGSSSSTGPADLSALTVSPSVTDEFTGLSLRRRF